MKVIPEDNQALADTVKAKMDKEELGSRVPSVDKGSRGAIGFARWLLQAIWVYICKQVWRSEIDYNPEMKILLKIQV